MSPKIQESWDQIVPIVSTFGLSVVAAIVILIVGWIAAGWIARLVIGGLTRADVDQTLRGFLASLARYAVLAFTIVAVLSKFGVETTSFAAVIGAFGLAIGFALQGTLGHLAAGVMLLLFRPFKVGDFIETGAATGTVDRITLAITEMHTSDNVQLIVPNGALWASTIKNYSQRATRRVEILIGIGYGDDIGRAQAALMAVIEADPRAHTDPEPSVVVGGLGPNSVDLIVRVWCAAGDNWPLKCDLTKAFKEKLDREGIEIPFPQRTVHLVEQAAG